MTAPRIAKPHATETDAALDPYACVWVSASAGSGKTTLLTRRVLRLLLEGKGGEHRKCPQILCLTYTRAAAAEMQNRVHSQLAVWATMQDDALGAELVTLFGIKTDRAVLRRARQLFSSVLDNPAHVRVMTMHSFCQLILHRFPLEAGVAPHFTLLEGEALKRHQEDIISAFLRHAEERADIAPSFQDFAESLSPMQARKSLEDVLRTPEKWDSFFENMGDDAVYEARLREGLQLPRAFEEKEFLQRACSAHAMDEKGLQQAADALATGSSTDIKRAEKIHAFLGSTDRVRDFEKYQSAFLTKTHSVLATLATKSVVEKNPDVLTTLMAEAERVVRIVRMQVAERYARKQLAFIKLARHLHAAHAQKKAEQAALTFDDLISATRRVLQNEGLAQWILYKLDNGLDHLLIDEAQDTSPAQWDIVLALLDEFFSGKGARDDVRTVFVVGDEKQSIYSFQGADRAGYLAMKDVILKRLSAAGKKVVTLSRSLSYRTGAAVLSYVDAVFTHDAARKGVSEAPTVHQSGRGAGGSVELWPPLFGAELELPAPWTPPLTREDNPPASVQLAARIAGTIATWLNGAHQRLDSEGKYKPILAGDIMILLQRRSHFLAPLVRALKDAGVPVAGIDRMVLHEQAAVQDVLALCRFLLLPQNDLVLAEVLRSPFIRISDEKLFHLAAGRNSSLWERLSTEAHENKNSLLRAAYDYLKQLLNEVDHIPVFNLLCDILYRPCPADARSGQHALTLRLGHDAIDPLDELLSFAIGFEEQRSGGLQRFVKAVTGDEREMKRELSKATGEVRILTAHGAKGLEAPIVFIPDLMRNPNTKGQQDTLLWTEGGQPFLSVSEAEAPDVVVALKEKKKDLENEEHRRLLYVALTRAQDLVILCGAANKRDKNTKPPWYEHALAAMKQMQATEILTPYQETVWRVGQPVIVDAAEAAHNTAISAPSLPSWAFLPVGEPDKRVQPLNPSRLGAEDERVEMPDLSFGPLNGLVRGRLMHTLLEYLPSLSPDERESRALFYLKTQTGLSAQECASTAREVVDILSHHALQHIYGPQSQSEAPLVGVIRGRAFSGQVDRLVVLENEILVLDYKTNRPPPATLDGVPKAYLAQMAAYQDLLQNLYPAHHVRCFLLWTHVARLMELDEQSLKAGRGILAAA